MNPTPRPRDVRFFAAVIAALGGFSPQLGCSAPNAEAPRDAGCHTVAVERPVMGTSFRIEVIVDDEAEGRAAVDAAFAEVGRYEEILSNWSDSSQISALNRTAASGPVAVSPDLMEVLDRALAMSALTDGAFDITFASCEGLWSVRDRRVPEDREIEACLEHVDYRKVELDRQSSAVFISDPASRIGLAGLAKGFRVDRAAAVLVLRGIENFAVDGGGDIRLSSNTSVEPWEIHVAHPRQSERLLGTLALRSGAIATSGDYQWYFERDGVRYHHILDPATGRPARAAVAATVIAPTAMDADALATGLFVMGPERGIALAERLPNVEALIVAPDLSLHTTSGFPAFVDAEPQTS